MTFFKKCIQLFTIPFRLPNPQSQVGQANNEFVKKQNKVYNKIEEN